MDDTLQYVETWKFDPPVQTASFRFNSYAGPRKNYPPAKSLYSDQPSVELILAAQARRHAKQAALSNNPKLSLSQLGDWRDIAAAIYDVTLRSTPTGRLQEAFLGGVLAERQQARESPATAVPSSSEDDEPVRKKSPFLGVTPEQPLIQRDRGAQLEDLSLPASALASRRICLFNVVVACEWWPISSFYQRQLLWTFRRMSDFLYDVTDGYMALGNVAVGGPEWMDYADIQILASNRLHPRSWVSAMQIEQKYMPIRVGRGLWNKRTRRTMPWDEPEGYRTLVHEWAHYALGLKDRYLELVSVDLFMGKLIETQADEPQTQLAVPSISLPLETIMAVLVGTSELVDNTGGKGKADEWDSLRKRFPELGIPDPYERDEGPGNLPLPLPELQFIDLLMPHMQAQPVPVPQSGGGSPDGGQPALIKQPERESKFFAPFHKKLPQSGAAGQPDSDPNTYPVVIDSHCWVFTIRGPLKYPEQLLAHGTLDAGADVEGFALPGAEPGDTIVLIGDGYSEQPKQRDEAPCPIVLTNTLGQVNQQGVFSMQRVWQPMTPAQFPIVDVYPEANSGSLPPHHIEVVVDADGWSGWVFPLGARRPAGALQWPFEGRDTLEQSIANARGALKVGQADLSSLDGHILLTNVDDPKNTQITIVAYSIGGGPKTINPPYPAPFPAGSSEGNALLFFYDPLASTPTPDDDPNDVIVAVTTRNYGVSFSEAEFVPCSYTYSFASNKRLPEKLHATLIMFVDRDTAGGDDTLQLRRYNNSDSANPWSTQVAILQKRDVSLAAAPLYAAAERYRPPEKAPPATAPGLFASKPSAERYRLVTKRLIRKSDG